MTKTITQNRVTKGVPTGGEFAATAHSDNVPSLAAPAPVPGPTAPKTSSKGRTTYVTLPDGKVASRTSKTKEYSHVVVLGPEVPELVIANRETRIRSAEASIAQLEEALKDPKFTKSRRFPRDENPDVDYMGRPVHHGFEYHLKSADGKTSLETIRGNSKGDTEGSYDPETFEYEHGRHGRAVTELKLKAQDRINQAKESIARNQADIDAVKNGTYELGGYGVASWASRRDLAEKATGQYAGWTRRVTVTPIDQ
jgi:hypothetical protein